MKITIAGSKLTPKWETLQNIVRECLDDEESRLVSIVKTPHSVDYRGPGEYTCGFHSGAGEYFNVELTVSENSI